MKLYEVTEGPVRLRPGAQIAVSDKQFATRAHHLVEKDRRGKTIYAETKNEIEFKRGEVLGLAALPRALERQVREVVKDPAKAA